MNGEKQREARRTTTTLVAFVTAMVTNWNDALGRVSANFAAMLWAKYVAETGNHHCYGWNIGNVKHVPGCGYDWHALQGVWEGVSQARADQLIASGQAVLETNEARVRACAPKVAVRFTAAHPASRFRSYDDLDQAMHAHLGLLVERFPAVVPAMHDGNVESFAVAMASNRYMTASAESYARAMRPHFGPARRSPEVAGLELEDVPEEPELVAPVRGTHVVDATIALREEMLRERWG